MKAKYTDQEIQSAQAIVTDLSQDRLAQGIERLRELKDDIYAAIPDKQRQSRGITWVVMRVSDLLVENCEQTDRVQKIAMQLYEQLDESDRLIGVPIFMMASFGKDHPTQALEFFKLAGASSDWVVREFAAAGLHQVIPPNRETIQPWLKITAQDEDPNLRRMVSEALRPVTVNRWLQDEPQYSLEVLRYLFHEHHPYPRTSVGNNLSDLSRKNPELIYSVVKELVGTGDKNSFWIAQRACRNLVKSNPNRVMDLLGVDEYRYKDRQYSR